MRRAPAALALVAAVAASVALVGAELGSGAWTLGESPPPHPCTEVVTVRSSGYLGYDAKIQEIALQGLDIAACRLDTTAVRLALALQTAQGRRRVAHGRDLEAVIRASLGAAVDRQRKAGHLNAVEAFLARRLVARTPLSLVESVLGL